MATRIARFAFLTLLACTVYAQIPANYTDLYTTLQQDLGDWQSTISVLCAGCPSYPWFGVGELYTANANNGPGLVTTANYMNSVDAEILMHKALGVRAIAVEVSFPMLYQGFFPAQGTTYDQWASFYSTVAAHIRNQGLQVIVESQTLIPTGVQANWSNSASTFYATFTSFSQYAAARAAAVANVAALMNPDYFILQEEPDTETNQARQPVSTLANAVTMLNGSVAAARGTVGFTGKVGAGFGSWLQQFDAFAKAYTQQSCGTCVTSKLDFLDIHLFPVNENASCSGCPTACVPCAHPDFVRTNAMSVIATAAKATNYAGGPMQMTMGQGWLRKVRDTEWPSSVLLDGGLYTSGDLQEARDSYSFWETSQSGTLLDQAWLTAVESLANYAHFLWLCPFNTQNWSAYLTWSTANALNGEGSTDPNNTPVTIYGLEINAANPARANASYTAIAQAWHDALAPSDVTAPTAPAGLTALATSPSTIQLTWTASTDDVGVAGYQVWRNGVQVGADLVSPFLDSGLAANTTYNYQVFAFDLANNVSLATTASATTGDTTAPSVPAGLAATVISASQINLSWTASTDPDSPVAGYFVYRNGTLAASTTTNSFQDTGLLPSTTYSYTVAAEDASGNTSAQSTAVSGTTPADATPPSVPTGLTPTVLSLSQISVSWTASTDPDSPVAGYFFYRNGVKIATATTPSFLDTGLLPLTLYTYTVAAYDASGNTSAQSSAVSATTLADTTAPTVPTGLAATVISSGQINLSWTASTDSDSTVKGYYIYRNGTKVASSTTTSYQNTGLAPSTTYSFTVAAYDPALNTSAQSTAVSATTPADTTPPSVPTGLAATVVSLSQINLSWTAATDPDSTVKGYNIYRNGTRVATSTTTSYQDGSLAPSTTYSYTVSAYDPSGNTSAQSAAVAATTLADTTAPSAPTALVALAVSNSQINLTWIGATDPDSTVAGYNVYQNGNKIATATALSFQSTGLTPGTTYSYTVSAYDPSGNTSAQSGVASATTLPDITAPTIPSNLNATAVSAGEIDLTWRASTDIDSPVAGYNIYRGGTKVGTSATNSYQDTGLNPSTTYSYKVSAYDAAGNTSLQSFSSSATTPRDTSAPSVPAGLTATPISTSQITVSWIASTDSDSAVSGYNVYRNGTKVGTSATTSFQDTGLTPTTTYSYKVSAYDPSGNTSAQSSSVSATTPADTTPPSVPAGLSAVAFSATQINLSWTASTDPDSPVAGYNIYQNGSQIGTATTNSFHSTGLAPSTTYSFTVAAYDASGNTSAQSSAAPATTLPDTSAPSVPTGLSTSVISATQINLSWNVSTDPDSLVAGYNVYRNGTQVGTSATNSYQDTGLTPSTTYQYKVAAFDPAGNTSAQSSSVSATTQADSTAPSVPAGLTAQVISVAEIDLAWTASTDPDSPVAGYNVYRNGTKVGTSATTSYKDTGVAGGTTYTYTVSAYDAGGNTSAQSDPASATTPPDNTAPSAPTGLTATAASSVQINLSWVASTDPDSPVGGYNIYQNGTKIGTSITASFQSTGLTPGATYSYTVSAYDASGNTSAQSTAASATTPTDNTPPSVPTGLSAAGSSATQINLSWTASTDPDSPVAGYNVYRNGSKVGTSAVNSYQDTGLTPSTSYGYTVSAYDAAGNTSAQSTTVTGTTLADTSAPSVPTGLVAQIISDTQINLSWAASTDPDSPVAGYNVYRNGAKIGTSASPSYQDLTALPSTTYSYTASAYDPAGNASAQSTPVSATTPADNTPPTVTITSPAPGSTFSSHGDPHITLSASASDPDSGVASVQFFVDGASVGTVTLAPYSISYNTKGLSLGTHAVTAKATDNGGNTATSAPVSFTLQ